jgi:hypothetical protein
MSMEGPKKPEKKKFIPLEEGLSAMQRRMSEEVQQSEVPASPDDAPAEWKSLIENNPEGDGTIREQKYWRAGDGAVYIEKRRGTPMRVAHGGLVDFQGRSGERTSLYWNNENGSFGETDPLSAEIRAQQANDRQRAQDEADAHERTTGERRRARQQVAAVSEQSAGDASGENIAGGVGPELLDRDTDKAPDTQEQLPAKTARKRKKRRSREGPHTVTRGDALFVKDGNTVRTANAEEIAAHGELLRARENLDSILKAPKKRGVERVEASPVEPMRDTFKDDMYEATGLTHEELKRRLEARYKNTIEPAEALLAQLAARHKKVDSKKESANETSAEQYLRDAARRDDFYIIEHNTAATTGRGEPSQNVYASRAMPGQAFTQEQVDAVERREKGRERGFVKPSAESETSDALDPDKFRPLPLSWLHMHPDAPGRRFTSEEIAAIHRGGESVPKEPDWAIRGRDEFEGLKPKTLREILASEEDQLYFGTLIESLYPGGAELKRKMFENEGLTAEERRIQNFARYEYARRMHQVEFIQSSIVASDIEHAARRDEDFDAVVGLNGSERTAEIFKRQIRHLGMKNRGMLDRLQLTYEELAHLRSTITYRAWDQAVQQLCAKAGTNLADYERVFKTGSKEERMATRRELQGEIREKYGRFRRVVDSVTGASFRKADRMVRKAGMLEELAGAGAVGKVDHALHDLTGMLRYTLVENPEVVRMLEQEAERNEDLSPAMENGPRTFKAAGESHLQNEKALDEKLDAHVRNFKMKDGRSWDRMNADERRESLAPLRSEIAHDEINTGKGWFSRALLSIYRVLFARKEEELINRPVAA